MKRHYSYFGLLIAALLSLPVFAIDKAFTTSGSILDGEVYYTVYVYNDNTAVSIHGGSITGDLKLFDSASAVIHGGTISMDINAFDNSCVELYSGVINDDVYLYETSQLKFYNGFIGDNLQLNDTTKGWLYGGTVLGNLGVHDSSVLSIFGGNTDYILWADGSSVLKIYGYDLVMTSSGGPLGHGQVLGHWKDNGAFTINLDTATTYTHIELYEVPEPCTLLLLCLGGLALRLRRSR